MTIELFGMARILAGTPNVQIDAERMTTRELIRALGERCPAMAGSVFDLGAQKFIEPNLLLLDGRRAIDADEEFVNADRPCILFLASGG